MRDLKRRVADGNEKIKLQATKAPVCVSTNCGPWTLSTRFSEVGHVTHF